jgi:hypothetical protein
LKLRGEVRAHYWLGLPACGKPRLTPVCGANAASLLAPEGTQNVEKRAYCDMREFLDLREKANLLIRTRALQRKANLAIALGWTISPAATRALSAHFDSYERQNPLVPALSPTGT